MLNFESGPTLYALLTFEDFLRLGHFSESIRARAMKLGHAYILKS